MLAVYVPPCHGCEGFPWWAEILLSLVGVAIAFLILYGLYKIAMRFLPDPYEKKPPPD